MAASMTPFPGRTDADGRRYGPLESAEAEATALAAKIFTREG